MFGLFKKEKMDMSNICSNIYDTSLIITEKLNRIVFNYGYTVKNKELFTSVASLFCYYFFENVLKKKYGFNDQKCFVIFDSLITELSSHTDNVTKEQTFKVFIEIKQILNNPPNIDELAEFVAINFMIMAVGFDEEEVDTLLLFDIYREFDTILKNVYKIY